MKEHLCSKNTYQEASEKTAPFEPNQTIGNYRIIECLAKGGMGEVYRAFDLNCEREVALKSVRTDLKDPKKLQESFLLEAKITSQLSHPSIIPVYSIVCEKERLYYTMPFVEGDTLRQVLRESRKHEKAGKSYPKGSIQALCRVFLQICQGIAYAHSQSVIHGDLKPENIIIGKYGQVLILDWGLAELMKTKNVKKKNMGTLSYLAPERVKSKSPSIFSDVYSLGVILFQILSLHFPFKRKNLNEFRKNMDREKFPDPNRLAPYRDIPKILSQISRKCLQKDPFLRYARVDELIEDLKIFLEGRSNWYFSAKLDPKNSSQWCFDANLLLEKNMAISGFSEKSYWAHWMLSEESFGEEVKIKLRFRLKENSMGLGFSLLASREDFGFLIWLSKDITVHRSNVEILKEESANIDDGKWHDLSMEKSGNKIKLKLDGEETLCFLSYLPSSGRQVGLLARDSCFEIESFEVFSAGPQAKVSCLAIADAFLAEKQFKRALGEYRRIAQSFRDRFEGREAMFKAGICLLESAKQIDKDKASILEKAWQEFETLKTSSAAPLEYLGKALIHKELEEEDLEANCLELACRKYKNHPLLGSIEEQIIYRLSQCSKNSRYGSYRFALLATKQIKDPEKSRVFQGFCEAIVENWERPYFLKTPEQKSHLKPYFELTLGFWLAKPHNIIESLEELFSHEIFEPCLIENAAFSLAEIEAKDLLAELFIDWKSHFPQKTRKIINSILEEEAKIEDERLIHYLWNLNIDQGKEIQSSEIMSPKASRGKSLFEIHFKLLESNYDLAGELLEEFSFEEIFREDSLLHFLYICWLRAKENKEIASALYSGVLSSPFPRSHSIACHYLFSGEDWLKRAFPWEIKQLYRQLRLYYHCAGEQALSKSFQVKAKNIF